MANFKTLNKDFTNKHFTNIQFFDILGRMDMFQSLHKTVTLFSDLDVTMPPPAVADYLPHHQTPTAPPPPQRCAAPLSGEPLPNPAGTHR